MRRVPPDRSADGAAAGPANAVLVPQAEYVDCVRDAVEAGLGGEDRVGRGDP